MSVPNKSVWIDLSQPTIGGAVLTVGVQYMSPGGRAQWKLLSDAFSRVVCAAWGAGHVLVQVLGDAYTGTLGYCEDTIRFVILLSNTASIKESLPH